jgi:CheY-like chemotaxis protein
MTENLDTTKNLLLVDDDILLLDMYALKFEEKGLTVTKAISVDEALLQLRTGLVPDVVVFDVIMPTLDGLDFLRKMKQENLAPKALLIALSNQTDTDNIKQAEDLGVTGYILKAGMVPSEVVDKIISMMQ